MSEGPVDAIQIYAVLLARGLTHGEPPIVFSSVLNPGFSADFDVGRMSHNGGPAEFPDWGAAKDQWPYGFTMFYNVLPEKNHFGWLALPGPQFRETLSLQVSFVRAFRRMVEV